MGCDSGRARADWTLVKSKGVLELKLIDFRRVSVQAGTHATGGTPLKIAAQALLACPAPNLGQRRSRPVPALNPKKEHQHAT